jgi:dolichyl-phosphate-mannose-protein mannosyltransferase
MIQQLILPGRIVTPRTSSKYIMSTTPITLRQRGPQSSKKAPTVAAVATQEEEIDKLLVQSESVKVSEWDYRAALGVITAMAFATRFWGIGHPDQVVFDEVHFGKVRGIKALNIKTGPMIHGYRRF